MVEKNYELSVVTSLPYLGIYFIEELILNYRMEFVIIQINHVSMKSKLKKAILNFIPAMYSKYYFKKKLAYKSIRNKDRTKYLEKLCKEKNIKLLYTYNINNDEEVKNLISVGTSQYTCVLGGRIISKEILNLSKSIWINGHGGVLPLYRGLCSEYWALANKDYEHIGSTIHYLTEKIDYGDILNIKTIKYNKNKLLFMFEIENHLGLIKNYLFTIKNLINRDINVISYDEKKSAYYSCPKKYSIKRFWKVH